MRKQATVDPLAFLTAGGARSRHEVEGSSEVQDEVSLGELAGVRARARAARRCDAMDFCRREGRVATFAVRSTGWAEAVLGSRDHDRADAPARLPVALAPSRRARRPGRVASRSTPGTTSATNRRAHNRTVIRLTCSVRATTIGEARCASIHTIRARRATFCVVVPRSATWTNWARSVGDA